MKRIIPYLKSFLPAAALCLTCIYAAQAQYRAPSSREEIRLSFAPLVKRTAPAVVNIYTSRRTKTSMFDTPGLFYRGAPRGAKQENSLGSGVIISNDGVIVTCDHVVRDSENVTVILQDKREFKAEILYSDDKTDLAVLKIENGSDPLPVIELMNSDNLEVGDLVLAIGNPFGVGQTVTSGIVSALARAAAGVADYSFFIQTDASINPGNSGGALVNTEGKLAGVNTAIYSRSGGSNGIGFAIPANMVRAVTESVLGHGRIIRPWLGVQSRDVNKKIADALGLRRPEGVLITGVLENGPAARAGLRPGDVILGIGEHDTPDQNALRFRIATYSPGRMAQLKVFRNSQLVQMPVRMEAPAENPPRDPVTLRGGLTPFKGATVINLSPAVADQYSLDFTLSGIMIESIERGSPAEIAGLQPGDVIASINGAAVPDTRYMDKLVRVSRSRVWEAQILRDGNTVALQWRF